MAQVPDDDRVPVAVAGFGLMGREVARAVLSRPDFQLVGVLDPSDALAGHSVQELLGTPTPDELRVETKEREVLARAKGGVLLQLTGSRLPVVIAQVERALRAGVNVISSCEELSFPWLRHAALAEGLETLAAELGLCVLGAGINPGFVLDRLVCTLAAASGRLRHVGATRIVDAATRRPALRLKVGAGLTRAEWDRGVDTGDIGHVGLSESAALVSAGLGLDCEEFDESIDPVIAADRIERSGLDGPIERGRIAGCTQVARGFSDGRELVSLSLTIAVGAADPRDEIEVLGEPDLRLSIAGGLPGESGTAWTLVNAVGALITAEPGLLTVLDLPAGR